MAALAPLPVEVVVDPGGTRPSAWRTYRACLERETDADWLVIVQDDAVPCSGFPSALIAALAHADGHPVALFVPTTALRSRIRYWEAQTRGESWCQLAPTEWVPVVALAWPVALIAGFLKWCDGRKYGPESIRADDHIVGEWARLTGQRVLATIPSLVEHPDDTESLVNRSRQTARRALSFAEDGAARIDWNR